MAGKVYLRQVVANAFCRNRRHVIFAAKAEHKAVFCGEKRLYFGIKLREFWLPLVFRTAVGKMAF